MLLMSVSNTVNMGIFERAGEFGTMRAIGDRSAHLFRLIVLESLWLGVLGATLGVVVGGCPGESNFASGHPHAAATQC